MRVLLVKMSSLGDVFHTFPALTDALKAIPGLKVDWVVEESFAEMAAWHPAVDQVFPVALRRWRKGLFSSKTRQEWKAWILSVSGSQNGQSPYDVILDAQGLIKSAFVSNRLQSHLLRLGQTVPLVGLDKRSAREPLATLIYDRGIAIQKGIHAIHRLRQLFAQILEYEIPQNESEMFSYGLDKQTLGPVSLDTPYMIALHGTTWETKLWPESFWIELVKIKADEGMKVLFPWGNQEEKERAERIVTEAPGAEVLPKMGLNELVRWLVHAEEVVGVDTGLSHVVAGLEVPSVAIYGATDPKLTGVLGPRVKVLQSNFHCSPCLSRSCQYKDHPHPPCYAEVSPTHVVEALKQVKGSKD